MQHRYLFKLLKNPTYCVNANCFDRKYKTLCREGFDYTINIL